MLNTPLARALLGMTYFALVMASYYLLKPIREALFLDTQGVYNFPVVHLWNCLATFLAVQAYDKAARRWRPGRLAIWSGPLLALQILVFALFMRQNWLPDWLPWIYYIWVSVFSVFAPTLLWTLVNNAFTTPQGEKYFGYVAVGGILGGSAGSLLTQQLEGWEIHHILGMAALVLAPVCLLAIPLDRARLPEKVRLKKADTSSSAWGLLRDRYLAGIATLMFLVMLGAEFADHQTQILLKAAGLGGKQLHTWYGQMYGWTNNFGLVLNLLLSRFLLKRFGPGPGMVALQLAVVCKAIAITVSPRPDTLMWALSLDLGIHYSLFQASKEVLYLPNHPDVKYRAKTLIDTFFFRFGIALAAILVLFPLRNVSMPVLSALVLATSLVCLALCIWLAREFERRVNQGSFRAGS